MCQPISALVSPGWCSAVEEPGRIKTAGGITFYEGKGCRTFKDPQPSYNSPIAKLVQDYPIKSRSVIAHIRQANRGEVALENTHPFTPVNCGGETGPTRTTGN